MNGGLELKLQLLPEKIEKFSRKEISKWWEIESLQKYIDVERVQRGLRIYTIPTYEDPDPDMIEEWAENSKTSSLNTMKILIKYAIKDRKKILEEIEKVEGQTKEKKYFHNGAGVRVQEAQEEEPGSKDTGKEKKSSGKQV
ncbi:hypothetical protein NDU88_001494 [Pleurodeles waltl]|uniref:Uncharacterized protein n=1 Tax=Pleurodeles waltl TaxID=8319 RepID=A0AAV7R865_PLEWA|nr:hypothetical protein NDU88_001494 [Pleurodeles waltl]